MNTNLITYIATKPILKKVAPTIGKGAFVLRQISPDIMFFAGLAGGVAAGIMGAKAYKQHDEVLNEPMKELAVVKEYCDHEINDEDRDLSTESEEYELNLNAKERAQLLMPAYGKVIGTYIRLYGPSVGMAGLSLYLLLASRGIVKGRNKALIATIKVLEQSFVTYRNRVREEYGDVVDERFYLGGEKRTVNLVEVDSDGKKSKSKVEENAIPEQPSPAMYSRIFDATCSEFSPDKEMNHFFLVAAEKYFNDILQIRGHVLLNDVYDHFGFDRTTEGCVVGWSLNSVGDDFVDFGIDKPINKHVGDNRYILDFNVNGVIFELI